MLGKESELSNAALVYDIYIIGEQIRSQMHRVGLIKDRRYRLRKYRMCFMGQNCVDWLVKICHAHSRGEAVMAMRCLQEYGMLHHVVDDHVFKDQNLYFRFSRDDDTYLLRSDLTAFYKGLAVFTCAKDASIRREFYHRGHLYQGAFYGCHLVDALCAKDEKTSRPDVVTSCRDLLEFDVIRHVTDDYHFSDDRLMYQFHVDYERPCLLSDVLHQAQPSDPQPSSSARAHKDSSVDGPGSQHSGSHRGSGESLSTLGIPSPGSTPTTAPSHYLSDTATSGTDDDADSTGGGGWGAGRRTAGGVVSVATRVVKLRQDQVGYGLVLRGGNPCYVQTVDPLGPAAAAGLREGQYVMAVGGVCVKNTDHRQVGRMVMGSTGLLTLVVLTKTDP